MLQAIKVAAPAVDDRAELELGLARIRELTDVAALLTSTFDRDQILSTLMDAALHMAGAEVGCLWLEAETPHARVAWGLEGDVLEQLRLQGGETVPECVTRTGEMVWSPDCLHDPRFQSVPQGVSLESLVAVPLRHKGHALGALVIANLAYEGLDAAAADSLGALAGLATVAIENARLHQVDLEKQALERELGIARQVQMALLPGREPEGTGIRWATAYFPMGKVGGDYFDFVRGPGGAAGVVVADVSDKGVPAALFMVATRSLVRREAALHSDPAGAVRGVNLALCEDTERYASVFVTLFYGLYEAATRTFRYANAGHCPALWLPREGEPAWLTARGGVLGQFPEMTYVAGEVTLAPDDLLVFYTDGVTEAHGPDDSLFGMERLLATVRAARGLPVKELAARIVEEVRLYAGPGGVSDDLTVLVGRAE
ncbi:MAG: SpoIIE family protein phosphatase [Candidatus Eisenbacteria bacterium]|nr:SpoIIE family protein phosphatase [Candidatus Eisenbacteria bacterium]